MLAGPAWPSAASAQNLASFEARTTVHVLPNGWTFIICERPGAPVFSFATQADVGAAQDPKGMTGLAHMSEHMAFKGTRVIGTTDWAKEGPALEKMDAAYMAWQKAKDTHGTDPKELEKLQKAFEDAQTEAQQYVKPNEFDELVSREGGVGMNAGTSSDATTYYYSLPANKFELFAYLESERFSTPVFREFYKERDVVIEERRLRTESQPTGRLIERFIAAAFIAHPYSNAPIGHRSDLERYTMSDSKAFFDKYYAPANLVTAIVGGIKAKEIIPVIDKYFGRHPGPSEAGPAAHDRASGRRRNGDHAARSGPADLHRGLPQAGRHGSRRARLRWHRGRADARPHLAALSPAGARQAALRRHPGRRLVPRRQVPAPVRVVRGAGPRRQDRRCGRGAAAGARAAEDRGHHRRGDGPLQDAGEGRPDPLARLERGPGREPRQLPDAVRRLA